MLVNIESSLEEMAVIDNILLRFWQMGWLPPLPHGRLGDLDALMPDFVKARWEFFSDGDTFLRLLKNAPTIVPAEGGKADGN